MFSFNDVLQLLIFCKDVSEVTRDMPFKDVSEVTSETPLGAESQG